MCADACTCSDVCACVCVCSARVQTQDHVQIRRHRHGACVHIVSAFLIHRELPALAWAPNDTSCFRCQRDSVPSRAKGRETTRPSQKIRQAAGTARQPLVFCKSSQKLGTTGTGLSSGKRQRRSAFSGPARPAPCAPLRGAAPAPYAAGLSVSESVLRTWPQPETFAHGCFPDDNPPLSIRPQGAGGAQSSGCPSGLLPFKRTRRDRNEAHETKGNDKIKQNNKV